MHPEPVLPLPGQESVWDYPRPPRLESTSRHIQIIVNNQVVVDTVDAWRVLEMSHPPVYYVPPQAVMPGLLAAAAGQSLCEWKGQARYFDLHVAGVCVPKVAWSYPNPAAAFAPIKDYVAFYAAPMQQVTVDDEVVIPQPGGFYGGWITSDVVGPFKGVPGSMGW